MESGNEKKSSVLLISASPALGRMLLSFLSRFPDSALQVREVSSYATARDLYLQEPCDLVLLTDTANGGSAIAWLHAVHSRMDLWHPVLFIHSGCDADTPFEALRRGAQDALPSGQLDSLLLHMAMRRILHYQDLRRNHLRMEQELSRSNQELSQFARSISHDLREPLHTMQAFGALLQESCAERLRDEEPFFLHRMMDAANRMDQRIRALLDYALIAHSEPDAPWTDLNLTLDQVRIDLGQALRESGGGIVVHGELPSVCANPHRMHQLLQNLLSNAVKYRSGERSLLIQVRAERRADHSLLLEVEDNGRGFSASEAEKLFQLFHREKSTEHSVPGHGIGLALCRRIAVSLNGSLNARGSSGQGACFSLVLPDVRWRDCDAAEIAC